MSNLCGAKTRSGAPCKNPAMPNGRCRMHGGKSLSGIASPSYKTGKFSKYLPARLLERYHEAEADPDLLNLRSEISLIDGRLADLLTRVDTGESGAAWARAQKALEVYLDARGGEDEVPALRDLEDAITKGLDDYHAWNEIALLIEGRRKLTESEQKRLIAMQQTITAEKAMLLIGAITDVIKRNVTDRAALAAISRELVALLNKPEREPAVLEG